MVAQDSAPESPQTDIAVRQHGGGRPAAHARSDQGASEVFGRSSIARKGETVLGATGVNHSPSDDLEVALGPPVAAALDRAERHDVHGRTDPGVFTGVSAPA